MRQTLERVLDDFGRRLAELRRAQGWTQARAAAKAGMPEKDYQAIENGRRAITIRTALALAQAFDLPLRMLFDSPASLEPRRPGRPATAAEKDPGAFRRIATEQAATSRKKPVLRAPRAAHGEKPKRKPKTSRSK